MFDLSPEGYIEIETQKNQVITIQHHDDNNDRHVIKETKQGKPELWQTWDIIYTDNVPSGYNDGEYNAKWGFYVGRPFHIVSLLGENRWVDVIEGNRVAIKSRNERKSQEWFFDGVTKTIKNKDKDQSLDMRNQFAYIYGMNQ